MGTDASMGADGSGEDADGIGGIGEARFIGEGLEDTSLVRGPRLLGLAARCFAPDMLQGAEARSFAGGLCGTAEGVLFQSASMGWVTGMAEFGTCGLAGPEGRFLFAGVFLRADARGFYRGVAGATLQARFGFGISGVAYQHCGSFGEDIPQGLKPDLREGAFAARLKPCPFKARRWVIGIAEFGNAGWPGLKAAFFAGGVSTG